MVIQRLDAVTIGQIAAGEVIERPVSVAKELVENALDAGATRVEVHIRHGGFEEISVVDNGSGIAPDQLPLAVERHATSKLHNAQGLEALRTLGFRGEGLASIAAVARLSIISRRSDHEVASTIEAFEDKVSVVRFAAGPVGTKVAAYGLFEHVPVRREYVRSEQAEATRIVNFLSTLALAYPQVAFQLRIDDREVFTAPPADSAFDRLAHVFGRDVYQRMLELHDIDTGMRGRIHGFVSRPGVDRGDRRMQLLFVNNRLLRSTQLAGAWAAAYAGFAMTKRHAFGVLFIEVPPDHIDPNVHPTKSDVRFRYAAQVFDAVKRVITTTLQRDAKLRLDDALAPLNFSTFTEAKINTSDGSALQSEAEDAIYAKQKILNKSVKNIEDPIIQEHAGDDISLLTASSSWQNTRRLAAQADAAAQPSLAVSVVPQLRVLAQLDRAFILATDGHAIVLVDQHAAHERVVFEEIMTTAQRDLTVQPLLVPDIIELDGHDMALLEQSFDALAAIGVDIEAFGERVVRVRAMPNTLAGRHFDVRGYLDSLDEETPGLDARQHVWATMACHSVIRAGEPMELAEMQNIIDRLAECKNPMHCPHGRPTVVRLDAGKIARLFRR